MAIRVVAVGKKHESWVSEGIERYQKRLKRAYSIEWVLLPHSPREGHAARVEESEHIVSRIKPEEFVILLDERGKILDSPALSHLVLGPIERSQTVVFIIGGAYGVDRTILSSVDAIWSLSRLVFPHQLVRLILAEQVYRAQEIAIGNPYHHR